jgi:hypothetical protein
MKRIVLPGSEWEEAEAGGPRRVAWSEEEAATLAEVIQWWRHRRERADAADPTSTHFGGVDSSGTARTVGLTPAAVAFARPLPVGAVGGGAGFVVQALGVPENAAALGEVASLVGLCHFYRDATAGWLCRYATLGRAPADFAAAEVRALVDAGGTPAILIVGVADVVIDWKVEVYGLEW